ncbi:hypothetical protein RB195_000962 [Necator americanus]|uniref:Uncharacterized protein n=1 Tax=Necator americanus TaxID=51031 RepID=A0ABR1DDD8_NECAM
MLHPIAPSTSSRCGTHSSWTPPPTSRPATVRLDSRPDVALLRLQLLPHLSSGDSSAIPIFEITVLLLFVLEKSHGFVAVSLPTDVSVIFMRHDERDFLRSN